jgi:hypothetical protein
MAGLQTISSVHIPSPATKMGSPQEQFPIKGVAQRGDVPGYRRFSDNVF